MYDLIGDIHGHADELVQLLQALGYRQVQGVYRHPDRRAIFLGDFIDRGRQIRQVLETVRPMIEAGHALAVMGNHELNALAYHTEDRDSPGEHLRRRCPKNERQHSKTLEQLAPQELLSYLEWFRTLPLWLDLDGLRVVHACWDEQAKALIAQGLSSYGGITAEFLHSACRKGNPLFASVEVVLKGKEGKLPAGASFEDNHGHVRTEIRTRWYLPPDGHTYRTYALQFDEIACDLGLDEAVIAAAAPYPAAAKPVFVGHYWLSARRPEVLAENVACLDYSVARGGFLCAYRWGGEHRLSNENFVWVRGG
jgi:calcineurin-like phosphoesterase family protein